MKIVHKLEEIPTLPQPIAFSLGSYDGVHLGHQHLFHEMKKRGTTVVLTFSNHPSEVLRPEETPPLIDTLEKKLSRMEAQGIDLAIVLPFTRELASMSYDAFLREVRKYLPFSHLILGEGDAFGYRKQGTEQNVQALARDLNFEAIYLPKLHLQGEPISSRRIRELIEQRQYEQAFALLGRKI